MKAEVQISASTLSNEERACASVLAASLLELYAMNRLAVPAFAGGRPRACAKMCIWNAPDGAAANMSAGSHSPFSNRALPAQHTTTLITQLHRAMRSDSMNMTSPDHRIRFRAQWMHVCS
jgi:hypothetical protein